MSNIDIMFLSGNCNDIEEIDKNIIAARKEQKVMDSISSSPYPLKPLKTVGSSSSSFSPRHLDDGKN